MLKAYSNLTPNLVDVFQIRRQFNPIHNDIALLMFFQAVDATDQRGFARATPSYQCKNFQFDSFFNFVFARSKSLAKSRPLARRGGLFCPPNLPRFAMAW